MIDTLTDRLIARHADERILFWGEGGIVFSNIRSPRPSTIQGRYLPLLQRAAPTGIKTSTLNGITTSKSRASICYVDAELGDKYKRMQGAYLKGCGKGELA